MDPDHSRRRWNDAAGIPRKQLRSPFWALNSGVSAVRLPQKGRSFVRADGQCGAGVRQAARFALMFVSSPDRKRGGTKWKKKKSCSGREEEHPLPVQELPTDIPAEVRQKLAEDLNEQATEDLKQDVREAEKEEANDEEVKANPEMLTKSRLLKLLVKKQYVKLREVTEEEQPADLAELLEELDENNRLVVFRLLKKDVATEAFAYMSDEARDDLVNAFSDVELVSAIEDMSLDDAADLLEDMPAGVVKRVLEKSSRQTRESLNKLLNYPESSAGSLMTPNMSVCGKI